MPLDSSDNQRNQTDTLHRLTFNLYSPIYTSLFTVIALLWFPQYSLEQCKHGNLGSRGRQIFFSFLQDNRTRVLLLFQHGINLFIQVKSRHPDTRHWLGLTNSSDTVLCLLCFARCPRTVEQNNGMSSSQGNADTSSTIRQYKYR